MTEFQRRIQMKLHDWVAVALVTGLLSMLYSLAQDWFRIERTLVEAAAIREALTAQIQELEAQKNEGPRHTACDTTDILGDLRSGSLKPWYPVEGRCKSTPPNNHP